MFIILVYDANQKRVAKFHKTCKKYLTWVQRSVFEGEITKAKYEKLMFELKEIIDDNEDAIIVYKFRTKKYYSRDSLGAPMPSSEDIFF